MGDHIGYRYEITEFLGKGSFGTALKCIDHKDKTEVAVKIVKNKRPPIKAGKNSTSLGTPRSYI